MGRCRSSASECARAVLLICVVGCGHDAAYSNARPPPAGSAAPVGSAAPAGSAAADVPKSGAAEAGSAARPPTVCPSWQRTLPTGHAWAYFVVKDEDGNILVDADVQLKPERGALLRAVADAPCAVVAIDQSVTQIVAIVDAAGFTSARPVIDPSICSVDAPCPATLTRTFDTRNYYIVVNKTARLAKADELPASDRAQFVAAVVNAALQDSHDMQTGIDSQLAKAGQATGMSANDLAVNYAEITLKKACDMSCATDPRLNPAIGDYLKNVYSQAKLQDPDPFHERQWVLPK